MSAPVIVVGAVNVDLFVGVEAIVPAGETVSATSFEYLFGGKGANQASAAAALGADVRLIARVGDDQWGPAAVADLNARGVGTSAVLPVEGTPTGTAIVQSARDGENAIVVVPGANERLDAAGVASALAAIDATRAVLVVGLEVAADAAREALRRARERGWVSVLNPSPVSAEARALVELADFTVVNEHEHRALGEAATDGVLIVTLGARGARLIGRDGVLEASAPPVDAVDTTGAGDALLGALAWAIARELPLEAALTAAVTAGSLATRARGARGSLATAEELG